MAARAQQWKLRVTKDRVGVLVYCKVTPKGLPQLAAGIETELQEMGVADAPTEREIALRLVEAAKAGPVLKGVPVAVGKPPVSPEDGRIEWERDFFATGFEIDETTGRVDFRRPKGHADVTEGQRLARLVPPRKGAPGRTVFGEEIPVAEPKPIEARAGANVREEAGEGGVCFFAIETGRVLWESGTITVEEMMTVTGDLGLQTGTITHPRAVLVQGSVLEGGGIEAGGDVEVMGVAEDAHISAGGDLVIGGGILESAIGTVRAKGNIQAKFVVEAKVEAGGDVVVAKELTNAEVKARGSVDVSGGRVVGGEVIALGGITVGQA